jgi:hypothetical protein
VLFLFHQPFLQVKTESLALKGVMRVDSVSLLNKRSQSFIGADNEALTVAAMRVSNPDRSAVGINCRDTAPTPTGFAQIVRDDSAS